VIFFDNLVHFVFIWYIFSSFGIMDKEKSGNPARQYEEKVFFVEILLEAEIQCRTMSGICRRR
jgi:hypothetical protein